MKYVVLTPVVMDGKTYPKDAQIDLGKEDAADLLACDAVRKMDVEVAEKKK
jgi:hypothetical protein